MQGTDGQSFAVFLERDGEKRCVTMPTETAYKAADMAEKAHDGWQATAVTVSQRYDIVGRCGRCKSILFEGDHARSVGNGVKCFEC